MLYLKSNLTALTLNQQTNQISRIAQNSNINNNNNIGIVPPFVFLESPPVDSGKKKSSIIAGSLSFVYQFLSICKTQT